jgi:hypothetical protein
MEAGAPESAGIWISFTLRGLVPEAFAEGFVIGKALLSLFTQPSWQQTSPSQDFDVSCIC